jgi:hypothetical protein
MRTKKVQEEEEKEEEKEEEEGSHHGSLVEGGPAAENWIAERTAVPVLQDGSRRHQKLRTGVPAWLLPAFI